MPNKVGCNYCHDCMRYRNQKVYPHLTASGMGSKDIISGITSIVDEKYSDYHATCPVCRKMITIKADPTMSEEQAKKELIEEWNIRNEENVHPKFINEYHENLIKHAQEHLDQIRKESYSVNELSNGKYTFNDLIHQNVMLLSVIFNTIQFSQKCWKAYSEFKHKHFVGIFLDGKHFEYEIDASDWDLFENIETVDYTTLVNIELSFEDLYQKLMEKVLDTQPDPRYSKHQVMIRDTDDDEVKAIDYIRKLLPNVDLYVILEIISQLIRVHKWTYRDICASDISVKGVHITFSPNNEKRGTKLPDVVIRYDEFKQEDDRKIAYTFMRKNLPEEYSSEDISFIITYLMRNNVFTYKDIYNSTLVKKGDDYELRHEEQVVTLKKGFY